MRMSRRAGLLSNLKLPTLAELFADAVAVGGDGENRSSARNAQFRFPKDTAVYLLCFHGGGYTVGKMYNTAYTQFIGTSTLPTISDYSSSECNVSYSMRAGSMVGVTFPNFPEKIADAVLTRTQQESILASQSTSQTDRYVQNTAFTGGGLYVAAHGYYDCLSISAEDSLFQPIFSYSSSSSYANRVYLYRSNNYTYLSANGTAKAYLYGGRISRLY